MRLVSMVLRRHIPDPIRRRRFRRAAKRLVPGPAWYEDELQANEMARAVLLRLLYLQERTRTVARLRQYEATALFARASIEGCIAGLYYLHSVDNNSEFRGQSRKMMKQMIGDIAADTLGSDFLDGMLEGFGNGKLPNVKEQADRIVENSGPEVVSILYERYYGPLSALYEHAGPAALFRHGNARTSAPRRRPYKVWSGCSASHTVDATAAILSGAIAGRDHPDFGQFQDYADSHWRLVTQPRLRPVFGMILVRMDLRHLPKVVYELLRLRKTSLAGEDITDVDLDRLWVVVRKLLRTEPDDPVAAEINRHLRGLVVKPSVANGGSPGYRAPTPIRCPDTRGEKATAIW